MNLPILPMQAADVSPWYYGLPADEQRRLADLLARAHSHRAYRKSTDQLSAIEVRIVLARARRHFAT
jgi:hypothetical protein